MTDVTARTPSLLVLPSPCLAGIVVAVALGWVAARLNVAGFAPVGILPLAIGIAVGAAATEIAAAAGITCPKRLILATLVLAILTVVAEHAWLYHDFCRQWREARTNQAQIAMFRPESPWSPAEYFAREATPIRVTLWCVDATILVMAAVGTVLVWRRKCLRSASPATRPT
jgi:hypothetical protein